MTARILDQNGFIEIKNNPLSKVGVFPYLGKSIGIEGLEPDKIYNVYRPEEELSNEATINSFKLLPWIDEHTMLGDNFTPAEKKGVEGVIGEEIYFKDGYLLGNIRLFSERLKDLINSGKKELSCGYRCVYELSKGVFEGMAYDVVQREIRGNHLALVNSGRMGKTVSVLDNKNGIGLDSYNITINEGLEMNEEQIIELIKKVVAEALAAKPVEEQKDEEEKPKQEELMLEEKAKDEEEEEKATDMEEEKKGMDAAIKKANKIMKGMDEKINTLSKQLDEVKKSAVKDALKEIDVRNDLAKQLYNHVGVFDHSEMTTKEVAEYAVKKLALKSVQGEELATVRGFMQHKTINNIVALDSKEIQKDSQVLKFLGGL